MPVAGWGGVPFGDEAFTSAQINCQEVHWDLHGQGESGPGQQMLTGLNRYTVS